jgi:hypothetical protein
MTFKPATWQPIALVLSVLNWVGAGLAMGQGEPVHATVHIALGVAFALWAQRLRAAPVGSDTEARIEALEVDVMHMRRELSEAQERLDFAERLLAKLPQSRQLGSDG